MTHCEHYQALMVDHLYGLLDASDSAALIDHAAGCAACRAELARAEEQRRLIAAAARSAYPEVRFEAPSPSRSPLVFPGGASSQRWLRWALAACLVLLVGGSLAVPGTLYLAGRQDLAAEADLAREAARRAEAEYRQAVQPIAELDQRQKTLDQERTALNTELEDELRRQRMDLLEKHVFMTLSGPPVIEPGAANAFSIDVQTLNNTGVNTARVQARLVDQSGKDLYPPERLAGIPQRAGRYLITLPADLEVKSDREAYLEVMAQADGGLLPGMPAISGRFSPLRSSRIHLTQPTYTTHLTTDKPLYQPGELVRFRSLTLQAFSLKPPAEDLQLLFSVANGRGEKVLELPGMAAPADPRSRDFLLGPDKKPIRGLGAGEYLIPANADGGEYTLTVQETRGLFPEVRRKFLVNRYEKPRLLKELEFTKKSYAPGDQVVAACKATPAEGGKAVAHQPVSATITIDGRCYGPDGKESPEPLTLRTDAAGAVAVRFRLPASIDRGDASLAVTFTDGASHDTIVRPIPVVVNKLLIRCYPEGGDLVAGVVNRVYFQVRTPLDRPAELTGRLIDDTGKEVANLQTFHDARNPGANQGHGVFEFTPQEGRTYVVRPVAPTGITLEEQFPPVKSKGVIMHVARPVMGAGDPLVVGIHNLGPDRTLFVGAYCRGRMIAHLRGGVEANGQREFRLSPGEVGGVCRVTVFEEIEGPGGPSLAPVAERLVYRSPARRLDLALRTHREKYVPGERVMLSCEAKDEAAKPVPAILMLAVVDKNLLTLADEKTARSMPTHFLLTNEVQQPEDLEHADFFLTDHPHAALALDLLLGTQGWRRFAEQSPEEFREKHGQDAERLLARRGPLPLRESNRQEVERQAQAALAAAEASLRQRIQTRLAALEPERQSLLRRGRELEADQALLANVRVLKNKSEESDSRLAAAQASLAAYDRQWLLGSLLVLGGVMVLGGAACLLVGLLRRGRDARRYYAVAAACAVIFVALGIAYLPDLTLREQRSELAMARTALDDLRQQHARLEGEARAERALRLGDVLPGDPQKKDGRADVVHRSGVLTVLPPAGGDKAVANQGPFPEAAPAPKAMPPNRPLLVPAAPGADPYAKMPDRALPEVKGNVDRPAEDAPKPLKEEGVGAKYEPRPGLRAGEHQKEAAELKPRPAVRGGAEGVLLQKEAMPGGVMPPAGMPLGGAGGGGRGFPGGAPGGGAFGAGLGLRRALPPAPPMIVREYAHHRSDMAATIRTDFTETLYWNPVLILMDGTARAAFDLCDSVTTFQVLACGHTLDGRIGAAKIEFAAKLPFSVEPKIPIEITAGDRVEIPVAVANEMDDPRQVHLRFQAAGLASTGKEQADLRLNPGQRGRHVFTCTPSLVEGLASIRIDGRSDPGFGDAVERSIRIVPDGFPIAESRSDLVERVAQHDVSLPDSWIPGTLRLQVQVYPSTLADLQKGLEGLLREPHGCFEQTSTSNYPNLLILDYLRESDQSNPQLAARARELLDRGYQKLVSFECHDPAQARRQGYEWFGGAVPPHEALTAYGLLQFRDLAKVYPVDAAMVERTRQYLLSRRDGQGGFLRNPKALDTFGRAPDHITTAYIVWALTESGREDDLEKEIMALRLQAGGSADPYFVALVANSLLNLGRPEEAVPLLQKLVSAQKPDGRLEAAQTSITGSGGRDLQIETTSLALLAWLKANRPELAPAIRTAIHWLGQQRGGHGAFGSTQSTILALRALIAYTRANKRTAEAGTLVLRVAGKEASRLEFPAGTQEALVLSLPEADKHLKPGKNAIDVEITGNNTFPYTLAWFYQTRRPPSAENCPVRLQTSLDRKAAEEGERVQLRLVVQNQSAKGQGMAVAIVGLPAGLTLPEDLQQLKEYTRLPQDGGRPRVSAWETRGRELILYWRDLAPDARIEVPIDLVCRVPGRYRGPASRAYLYYNADLKSWTDPLEVTITPR